MPSSGPLMLGNAFGPVQLAGRLPSSWFSCRPTTCSLKNASGAHCPGRLPLSLFIWSVKYLQHAARPQHATSGAGQHFGLHVELAGSLARLDFRLKRIRLEFSPTELVSWLT